MLGCANGVESSLTSEASASNDHDTFSEDTPCHTSPVATTWRAADRISDSTPELVTITVGSSWNGTRNPPAESVRLMARYWSTSARARCSSTVSVCGLLVAILDQALR